MLLVFVGVLQDLVPDFYPLWQMLRIQTGEKAGRGWLLLGKVWNQLRCVFNIDLEIKSSLDCIREKVCGSGRTELLK